MNINGNDISFYLVGDSVYFFVFWFIKLFLEGINDFDEKNFNKEFSRVRVVVERVFGI